MVFLHVQLPFSLRKLHQFLIILWVTLSIDLQAEDKTASILLIKYISV